MALSMALAPAEIAVLDDRAQAVGKAIGWDLQLVVAPNPEFVGLTAGPANVVVLGPERLSDLAAYDVDVTLDALKRGYQIIFRDEDGDPRLGTPRS
jgi:hypothetical protein